MSDALAPLASLKPRQVKAIVALLKHGQVPAAAAECGIGARTLYRWTKLPAFQAALAAQARESMTSALAQLLDASGGAVAVLRDALKDPGVYARVQAAGALLGFSLRALEVGELTRRLDDLERKLEARDRGDGVIAVN